MSAVADVMASHTIYHWGLINTYRGQLLHGLLRALNVALASLVLSVVCGMLLAMWRMAPRRYSWPAALYINIFRGVPPLVSVIWVYFGLALAFNIQFSVFQASVIALVLLYSAFLAEIFRSALGAIPKGQREAGLSLGFRPRTIFFTVLLPQAAKISLPNVGSMLIGMVKDTSTFQVIGLMEVVYVSTNAEATTFQPFVLYTAAAAMYVIVAFVVDFVFRTLERSIGGRPVGMLPRLLTYRKERRVRAFAEA